MKALLDGVADARQRLEYAASKATDSGSFGSREFLGVDYVMKRAAAAYLGI
jgi:hypothetical protein